MEEKNDLENLLISYLLHELNAEEEAHVQRLIHADPDVKKDFEALENLLRLISIKQNTDAINLVQERRHLEELWNLRQQNNSPVAPVVTMEKQLGMRGRKYWRMAVAAASVIIVLGFGWLLLQNKTDTAPAVATGNKKIQADSDKIGTRFETNVTGKPRRFILPDGSEVILWDQSIVSFNTVFTGNKRDISLRGKASFKVVKDKTRPFTVYSDGIATTAMGTEFSVTSFAKENIITVRLEEGKVVVKSMDSVKGNFINPLYLLPGQELVYNKQQLTAIVRKFKTDLNDNVVAKDHIIEEDPSMPKNNGGTWFMFNNQSLSQIFDQLGLIYNVDIVYKKKDVEKMYFIGKFDKKDSLGYILQSIATINNLTLSKDKTKYIIRK